MVARSWWLGWTVAVLLGCSSSNDTPLESPTEAVATGDDALQWSTHCGLQRVALADGSSGYTGGCSLSNACPSRVLIPGEMQNGACAQSVTLNCDSSLARVDPAAGQNDGVSAIQGPLPDDDGVLPAPFSQTFAAEASIVDGAFCALPACCTVP
jgi:hypothetical protein